MIHSLQLMDFRSHKDTRIEFDRLTVLVGANGIGKSSCLDGIDLFRRLSEHPADAEFLDEIRERIANRLGAG